MTGWTFRNWTAGAAEVPVRSAAHAVELLAEHSSGSGLAVVLEFMHADRGLISCVAGGDRATLAFHPGYDPAAHSLAGQQNALRVQPVSAEPFYFLDSVGVVSSISARYVLPRSKVERALAYIVEHHDFPNFIRWSEGAEEE